MTVNENKYPCGLVRDLLPLYRDNVCGEESRKIVEEHLAECAECPKILEQLDDCFVEEMLAGESGAVLENHRKKECRTAVTAGLITAGILFIPMIVCLICNLASGNGLSWFYIVLTSLLTAASVTVVPMLSTNYRFTKTFAGFLISLFLLLLTCCIYTGGDWLWVAEIPTVFGLSLVCVPFVVRELPLPSGLRNRKTLITFLWDVLWLFATLAICCVYSGRHWFATAAIGCAFGLSVAFMPILIRQIPLPEHIRNHKALVVMIWDTLWLYALLFECTKYVPDVGNNISNYLHNCIWITSICLLLPWTIFILIRYVKLHPLIKTGLVFLFPALFGSIINDIIALVYVPKGWNNGSSFLRLLFEVITHTREADIGFTVISIVFESIIALGIILIVIGVVRTVIKKKNKR